MKLVLLKDVKHLGKVGQEVEVKLIGGKDISGSECEIVVPVTEEGALYGSVGTREISEAFSNNDIQIDKSEVQLPDGPIKETGDHNIVISVHPEVNVEVLVKVLPE